PVARLPAAGPEGFGRSHAAGDPAGWRPPRSGSERGFAAGVIPAFPVYLFDIDGTLLDSAEDICGAVRQVLEVTPNSPPVTFHYLKSYLGRHLFDLFGDVFPGAPQEQLDEMLVRYRQLYPARGHRMTQVYPGVAEALAVLGGRKGTATTKGTPTTRAV